MITLFLYHDDFLTPGISCLVAISLKQILHTLNFLMYPCFLPHRKHRLTIRELNLGFFLLRTTTESFAIPHLWRICALRNKSLPITFFDIFISFHGFYNNFLSSKGEGLFPFKRHSKISELFLGLSAIFNSGDHIYSQREGCRRMFRIYFRKHMVLFNADVQNAVLVY